MTETRSNAAGQSGARSWSERSCSFAERRRVRRRKIGPARHPVLIGKSPAEGRRKTTSRTAMVRAN